MNGTARGVAVNPTTNMIYVPVCTAFFVCGQSYVYVIDGATQSIVPRVPVGLSFAIAVNPATNLVYVTTS